MQIDQAVQRWPEARRVCVLGAGTMGTGIAGHLANLGFQVTLLDISQSAAGGGLDRAKVAKPPHFFVPETANEIRVGGIDERFDWVSEADWVIEAIVEKMDIKRDLFSRLEPFLAPHAMVSTNTSGLQIELLAEGRGDFFRERFLGTHFFNPPRYLHLLELIPTSATSHVAVQAMTRFLEERVARRVVIAKDTPGFIANRYGMWSMFQAIRVAERLQLTIEEVDAITGPFLGRPRSGSFRLNDIVGLDIMADIASNILERCPDDPHREVLLPPPSMTRLLEKGWIGEKVKQGYYRREGKELMALDLRTFAYRERQEPEFASLTELSRLPLGARLSAALELRDPVGEFLRHYLIPTLKYADYLKEEISHSVEDFDRVMRWGFAWELGPFEMIDAVGAERLGLHSEPFYRDGKMRSFGGGWVPRRHEPEFISIQECPVIDQNDLYAVRDLGDEVVALATRTKLGVFTVDLVEALLGELERGRFAHFVLTSESSCFSAGFDLKFVLQCIDAGDLPTLDRGLARFQELGMRLGERAVVAAVHRMALGGGLEMATGCASAVFGAECQVGFPEAKVGVVPSGGGLAWLRARYENEPKVLAQIAVRAAMGHVSSNAVQARKDGFLRSHDVIEFHPDRVLFTAKQLALATKSVSPPTLGESPTGLVGLIERGQEAERKAGNMSEHDEYIGDRIKAVLVKSSSFEEALKAERAEFLHLCSRALSIARIRHMVEKRTPLRN